MSIGGATISPRQAVAGLRDALYTVIASLDHDQLALVGDDELLGFIRDFESVRNRMAVVDHEIVAACETTGLPHRLQLRTTTKLLVETVRIDYGEAHRRVAATRALRGETTMLGEKLAPQRPELAAAVAAGLITPTQTGRAVKCLRDLQRLPWANDDQLAEAEHTLTTAAQELPPHEFREVVEHLSNAIDPDGQLSEDQIQEACRGIEFWRGRDGMYRIQGRVTGWVANQMKAVLDPLAKPLPAPDDLRPGVVADDRTPGQRLHDAFGEVFGWLLHDDQLSDAGGYPATVIVTIDYRDLARRSGFGRLADGSPIAPDTLLRKAAEAEIIPVVLGAGGEVLSLGRSCRIANKRQTAALIARDGGCSFPGCDRPPSWCERHHIISWLEGGPTDVDNLTLLCSYHHHYFEQTGWTCRMDHGLPTWIPPRWIDPEQTPRLNYRIAHRRQPVPV